MNFYIKFIAQQVLIIVTFFYCIESISASHAHRRYSIYHKPVTVEDYSNEFNEKSYWIETDSNGKAFICYKRILLDTLFFNSPTIYCVPAKPIKITNNQESKKCWKAENIVICNNGNGSYTLNLKTVPDSKKNHKNL